MSAPQVDEYGGTDAVEHAAEDHEDDAVEEVQEFHWVTALPEIFLSNPRSAHDAKKESKNSRMHVISRPSHLGRENRREQHQNKNDSGSYTDVLRRVELHDRG